MPDVFARNTRVRLKTAPDRLGRITGETQERAGRVRYQVDFGDCLEYVAAGNLEAVEENEDIHSLITRGKYGSFKHLRMTMTHIRLSGRLADVIYSMEASNTEFYAYQFKPVINFLNSPSNGLLIADEVGLGKTIEAGLIWTEMRARFDANRLLVVAPAVLREKWQEELAHRFGVKADICNAAELLQRLERHRRDPGQGFAIISSLQGLRPPRDWERESDAQGAGRQSTRAELMRLLRDHEALEPLFDCVIVDEAHYLRNPETRSHELGERLRLVSDHLVLLSATPIQLKAMDLFYLLRLIDAQNFQYEFTFEEILRANAPILALSGALRGGALGRERYLELLRGCRQHPRFEGNRQLKHLETHAPTTAELAKPDLREALATRIDRVNLLAQVVNRTRKRFVHEHKVIRMPVAPQVEMTEMERAFYDRVTEVVRVFCQRRELSDGFILTIPQRQMCSSIPAAYRAWIRRVREDLRLQLYEMGGDAESGADESEAPLVEELASAVSEFADYEQLYREDSKFNALLGQLKAYWQAHPGKKVVLFSYYKETLRYLKERMDREGIGNQLLYGGMPEPKQEAIARFRENSNTAILLASEVASEGVDLQFASFLVNYDLPWNPMRVEQRIGRIDRIGQREDRILIQNYFYADTLDDRIYQRLFDRLDIFRHALGDLEEVLGEQVRELTFDLLSHRMTRVQEEERIRQTEMAIAHIRRSQEELEEEAMHFAAHGDYVLNQVRAAREMKRYIRGEHLWIYVHDFLDEHYPGCRFVEQATDELTVEMELSIAARIDLREFVERYLRDRRTRLTSHTQGTRVTCIFSNHVDFATGRHEVINQHHPLVRFITLRMKEGHGYPLVAARIARVLLPDVDTGRYLFVAQRWSTTGARVVERVVYRATALDAECELTTDDVERLVSAAIDQGQDAVDATYGLDGTAVRDRYDDLVFALDDEFQAYAEGMKMENEDRIELMIRSTRQKIETQIARLRAVNERLEGPRARNIVRANEGKIAKLQGHMEALLGTYEKKRALSSVPYQVLAGVISVE